MGQRGAELGDLPATRAHRRKGKGTDQRRGGSGVRDLVMGMEGALKIGKKK